MAIPMQCQTTKHTKPYRQVFPFFIMLMAVGVYALIKVFVTIQEYLADEQKYPTNKLIHYIPRCLRTGMQQRRDDQDS